MVFGILTFMWSAGPLPMAELIDMLHSLGAKFHGESLLAGAGKRAFVPNYFPLWAASWPYSQVRPGNLKRCTAPSVKST